MKKGRACTLSIIIFFIGGIFLPLQMEAKDYILHYKIHKYDNSIGDSVDAFVDNVFKPGDSVFFITPQKSYRLIYKQDNSLQSKPDFFKKAIKTTLQKDTTIANTDIKIILDSMHSDIKEIESSWGSDDTIKRVMQNYKQNRNELTMQTAFQMKLYKKFIEISEKQKKPLIGFTIVQQINQPIPGRELYDRLNESVHKFQVMELFMVPNVTGNFKKMIKKTAAQMEKAGMKINLLFYKQREKRDRRINYLDATSELFKNYKILVKKSGGLAEASFTPSEFFKKFKN